MRESDTDGLQREAGSLSVNMSDFERALQKVVLLSDQAVTMIANGAVRYVDYADAGRTPVLCKNDLYLPVHTLAAVLGYYDEQSADGATFTMRRFGLEFHLENGIFSRSYFGGLPQPIDNPVIVVDGRILVPVGYFAKALGMTTVYREHIMVVGSETDVVEVLREAIFEEAKREFAVYAPEPFTGKVYYVSQKPCANDANDGSQEAPFRTLARAGAAAQAGDTVIIGEGVYRETLRPQNDGTPARPIVFRAAPHEKVVISANEMLDAPEAYAWNGKTIWRFCIDWDLGRGRHQLFCNGRAIAEARYPKPPAAASRPPELELDPLWFTQGDIRVDAKDPDTAVSEAELQQETDAWKGGVFVSLHGYGWALSTADIVHSEPGVLHLCNQTRNWWFTEDFKPTDGGYITCTKRAITGEYDWTAESCEGGSAIYFYPPSESENLQLEIKKRQVVLDLAQRRYIRVEGIQTIGGGARLNDSEMCVLKNCDFRYISHFTASQDQREGFIDDGNICDCNGAPPRGEMGFYIGGRYNAVLDSRFAYSAGAAIYLTGVYGYFENNTISDCGYMGSYVGGLFMGTEAWKNVCEQRGGHAIFHNTISNAGRSVFNISVNEKWIHSDGVVPYLPCEIAYNKFFNSGICTRDVGVTYAFGAILGSDVRKTKFHDNLCYDSWCRLGESHNFGIYFDNFMQMIEVYDNLVLYNREACVNATDIYIQPPSTFPTSFASADVWNNSTLGLRRCGEAELSAEDYPYGVTFAAGSDWNGRCSVQQQSRSRYGAERAVYSATARLTDGVVSLSGDGEWIKFSDVDFDDGNMITIFFTQQAFRSGDVLEVTVTDASGREKTYPMNPIYTGAPSETCLDRVQVITRGHTGSCDVTIKAVRYCSIGITRIALSRNEIDAAYAAKVYTGDCSVVRAGDTGQPPCAYQAVPGDSVNRAVCGTLPGTVLHYPHVELLKNADTLVYSFSTGAPYDCGVFSLRIGAPDAPPIVAVTQTGEGWYQYPERSVRLEKPLTAGIYDIYLTFDKTDDALHSSNFYYFGFKDSAAISCEQDKTETLRRSFV